ncbi:MAG TPA: TetR/AcrR family transcriptional regulator [Acidimicrobiales bacterium]|nr:TetR/AcrR family transcriptional regulator [Acidimicrobiales bacterium]
MAIQAPSGEEPSTRPAEGTGDPAARLVEAARALLRERQGPSFTVSQVVRRAGSSLKSFYRCFESKDELLVALFEDDSRRGAAALAALVERRAADGRLRAAVTGLFEFLTLNGLPYAGALVAEHLRLAQDRPAKLRAVLQPYVSVFEREVAGAMARGEVRAGDPAHDAQLLFNVVVSHLQSLVYQQIEDPPEQVAGGLWAFCAAALRPEPAGAATGAGAGAATDEEG